jgi:hypothetical protein
MACLGVVPRAGVAFALGLLAGLPAIARAQSTADRPPATAPSSSSSSSSTEPAAGPADSSQDAPTITDPERVKRALARPPSGLLEWSSKIEQVDATTYRVTVTQKPFDIWQFWGPPETAVAPYVRTWYFSTWHSEYLRMVTPEEGRRAALYPTAMMNFMPAIQAVAGLIKDAARAHAERKAKQEVQDALEAFFREHPEARTPVPAPPDKAPVP